MQLMEAVFIFFAVIFILLVYISWSAIESVTLSSFLSPPSSLWLLFGRQWNFDARPLPRYGELNMSSPDLLSAATSIPLASTRALKTSENPKIIYHPRVLEI